MKIDGIESTITADDFERFRKYFYQKTGIDFEPSKRYFVDKRLIDRVEATRSGTFGAYFTKLRCEVAGAELQQLTNTMTVNETYFAREEYQFRCLVESMLPDIVKRKTDKAPIRIWCIPSSSGEEPYTVAMFLIECWPGLSQWDVEIISSDIDTGILLKAKAGRFSARSVNQLPKAWLAKHFRRIGDEFQISDDLRQSVEFTRVNLSESAETKPYRNFDVVFCRNLLIYFDDVSRKAAAETFYDALLPGGFLCLGHSESMSRISSLYSVRKFPEAIVYQKPQDAQ